MAIHHLKTKSCFLYFDFLDGVLVDTSQKTTLSEYLLAAASQQFGL